MSEGKVPRFSLFSPADYRYYVMELEPYFSEESYVKYKCRIEAALATVLGRSGLISQASAMEIVSASLKVDAEEVYREEQKTGHDIIALVNMIKSRTSEEARTGVHKTATSYDIVDSANALRYREAFAKVIIPDMVALEKALI
jgi:adenylosuccinate lyase